MSGAKSAGQALITIRQVPAVIQAYRAATVFH
jgi:hypothetical protein